MTGGGAKMKPPPVSLYRNFILYIWRQLSARRFCISVLIQHDSLVGLFLLGIVLWPDRLLASHKDIWSRILQMAQREIPFLFMRGGT